MMRRQGAGPGSQVRNLIGGGGATMGGGAEDAEQEARLAKQRQYRLELEQQAIEKQERKRREKAEREALDRKHEECVAPAARCAPRRRNMSTVTLRAQGGCRVRWVWHSHQAPACARRSIAAARRVTASTQGRGESARHPEGRA